MTRAAFLALPLPLPLLTSLHASAGMCDEVAATAAAQGAQVIPRLGAQVVNAGRLHLLAAPSAACRSGDVIVEVTAGARVEIRHLEPARLHERRGLALPA